MMKKIKMMSIVGARPQFIKLAPLAAALEQDEGGEGRSLFSHTILHTGQHYDYKMNKVFFDDLGIPEPDVNLEVGSSGHARQTGEMLSRIEKVLIEVSPDLVLVYGDTNSTIAGALAAKKLHIPVAHIEAGLRSFNRRMPEEINRILTDHCSDILFVPTLNAALHLRNEGFSRVLEDGNLFELKPEKMEHPILDFPVVVNAGDIMFDALRQSLGVAARKSEILRELGAGSEEYFLATIHRAENTDFPKRMEAILEGLKDISRHQPVYLPLHPRTRKIIDGAAHWMAGDHSIRILDPLGYMDMLTLLKNASAVLTDSGGIQKEAFFLKVPCITLRDETEWVETVDLGWNVLAGADRDLIVRSGRNGRKKSAGREEKNPFGDARTARRILSFLAGLTREAWGRMN